MMLGQMKEFCRLAAIPGAALAVSMNAAAGPSQLRNMPSECARNDAKCKCADKDSVGAGCIKVNVDMGETTPWTGSMECSLRIFADAQSPMVFTPESLCAIVGGHTFKRLGNGVLSDGRTPSEVVFAHPNGENVYFAFKDGESWGRPNPGVHTSMDERLMMVDAEGWAATSDPVYYDLYEGDGTRRRFLATDATGELGKLVSTTDSRGVEYAPEQMGVDIVYAASGVRQFLTPSRLADVVDAEDHDGYTVTVYPFLETPEKDGATGLYALPDTRPVTRVSIRSEKNGSRAVVTTKSGDAGARTYVFDYLMGDWSLTRPGGVQEWKERHVEDSRAARLVEETRSKDGRRLARTEMDFKWESWGFAMTNRVEGFDGATETTRWTYYGSGNGKGQVKTELRQSGLLTEYAYDASDRIASRRRSGPGMMAEETVYGYESVDAADEVPPVDDRPRTVVKTLDGVECERTYYVYSPLTNVVERAGTQGAAYGGTGALRTVTAFYPVVAGDIRSGMARSIRHEDGRVDACDYALDSGLWTKTVTHLHEQSPEPVDGRTTRDVTVSNGRGETLEIRTEAYVGGAWHAIARERMSYNLSGKVVRRENLAGQVTATDWDCCHKTHEIRPDGSATAWDYDEDGRVVETSRLIPLDLTNQTWVSTCYEYDGLGRQIATWQTNAAMHVGLPASRTAYDPLGRITNRVDALGNDTTTTYGKDGLTASVRNPNTSTRVSSRNCSGDIVSITGSAVTPEFHAYGILPDGTRWTKIVQGETAESPRFTKRYENMLGQTIREERSGFQGAVLATVNTYDGWGRIVSTVADGEPVVEYAYDAQGDRMATARTVGRAVPCPPEWRKTEEFSSFALFDGAVWLARTNVVSCSDAAISPLVTSSAKQLTGLSLSVPSRMRSTDVRGNVTETWTSLANSCLTSYRQSPYATNAARLHTRYGVSLMDVSVSAVTNTYAYDGLGRSVATTDGRGNTTRTEYDISGQVAATIDALGNRTAYAYDQIGNLVAVTNPLGNATVYEYDLRGRKTYEGGATYPVRYTYDVFGNKTTMTTYRNESLGPDSGDVTTWLYDEASGSMTNKVYADGKGPTYSYTPDGKLAKRVWARGIVTDYSYDGWGNLTDTVYSDETPTISLAYDTLGRQTEAHDAAGVTTFAYDAFGSLTNETVVGVAGTNTIERYWDVFGRTAGYALNGERQTTIGYCPATGRIDSMLALGSTDAFHWSYLLGSDLKARLLYPNGLTASWQYDAAGQLLLVCNATPTNVISQYDYTYDAAGRRVACAQAGSAFAHEDVISYGYNDRSELTNAVATVEADYRYSYDFDCIGNRVTSHERGANAVYSANNLNQYMLVGEFVPQFDDDGNQIRVKTATSVWEVAFDAENRPIVWRNGTTNIVMVYDRLCRRILKNDVRYVYKDFLQVNNSAGNVAIWDPTELEATRPLHIATCSNVFYCVHDGDKNVSEIVPFDGSVQAHYGFAPFGALDFAKSYGNDEVRNFLRFGSEYSDDETGTVYYNFRSLNPMDGRWSTRDPGEETFSCNLYWYLNNRPIGHSDWLGLSNCRESNSDFTLNKRFDGLGGAIGSVSFSYRHHVWQKNCYIKCDDCRIGYTVERDELDGGGGGLSWNLPISGLPAVVKIPVSVSYALSGGERYYYNSCSNEERTEGCHSFSVSGSGAVKIGVGRFIEYSGQISVGYSWTDCGGERSSFDFKVTLEQCYFGQCWSVDVFSRENR